MPSIESTRNANTPLWWLLSLAIIVLFTVTLRFGTNILDIGGIYDEIYIRIPIDDLVEHGWSMQTAIDFKETKGPTLIWTYAVLGELIGSELNDYRLITAMFFVLGTWPLLLIASRCGLRGMELVLATVVYALLPYNAVLGQLLMSEATFVFGTLWLWWIFLWAYLPYDSVDHSGGRAKAESSPHPVIGPILFAIVLSILLHNRIHAVAYAGAVCLVTLERDRLKSWPWWLACVLAGLSRIPLMIRWDGFVHPDYQNMHATGFRLNSLTYLAAALIPFTLVFCWPFLKTIFKRKTDDSDRTLVRALALVSFAASVGCVLGIVASPSLKISTGDTERFQGVTASAIKMITNDLTGQSILLALMAAIGLASLAVLGGLAWSMNNQVDGPSTVSLAGDTVAAQRVVQPSAGRCATVLCAKLTVWTLLIGWALYALTSGWVFDRYLLPWGILVSILWVRWLPRWLFYLGILALAAILAQHANVWLINGGPNIG